MKTVFFVLTSPQSPATAAELEELRAACHETEWRALMACTAFLTATRESIERAREVAAEFTGRNLAARSTKEEIPHD